MKNKVYLDYASTSPLSQSFLGKLDILAIDWSNPSSLYGSGHYNKHVIEKTREKIANMINAEPEEIIFTSSGSEANALAIDGFLKANKDYEAICSNIEHASIYNNPNVLHALRVDEKGFVSPALLENHEHKLVSVMMVNNEIGTYQPIKDIVEIAHKNGCIVHTDAVQAFGKTEIDVKYLDVDMMSISGHKVGSLRGVGALYVKKGIKLAPIIYGEQENGLRGSTYNDFAIKSLSNALNDVNYDDLIGIKSKRTFLLNRLMKNEHIRLNGSLDMRAESNINIRIKDISISGMQIVELLDEAGFEVSSGSACHSSSAKPSHVLKAIGLSDEDALHSIRITIGKETSVQNLIDFADALENIIEMNLTA